MVTNNIAHRSLIAGLATLQLLIGMPIGALAIQAPQRPAGVQSTPAATQPTPLNPDLTSTTQNVPAPQFVQNAPISVIVGGAAVAVTPISVLTPGQSLAAYQVFWLAFNQSCLAPREMPLVAVSVLVPLLVAMRTI